MAKAPVPVYPTAHYTMGGIPTNRHGQVVVPVGQGEEAIPGLYAAGECACVSVHGANRLGGNSLLDIVVFGRAAGNHIIDYLKENRFHRALDEASVEAAMAHLRRFDNPAGSETVEGLRSELQQVMEAYCGVYREESVLAEGLEKVKALNARMADLTLKDQSQIFNTARIEAFELENLMALALATVTSALNRKESRGAHSRIDYPQRDDEHWLKHSIYYAKDGCMDYKPVRMKPRSVDSFPPKPRVY
jgi:succinate dehydrogenase / fumarate reductase flavoprotein subunit